MPTADVSALGLPFQEAIAFFKKKVSLPSQAWTDFQKSQHDTAFVVAGATKADLLADMRSAVTAAINDGISLQDFQGRFDQMVSKHGWDFKGGREWRAKVIMETNLRTSYAAGRYAQLRSMGDTFQFWEYHHGDSVHPRPQHLAWNGMVLRSDDPFWAAHYPPNGWGCRCSIIGRSSAWMKHDGRTGPDVPPRPLPMTHGEEVPGVDKGWGYTPGASQVDRQAAWALDKAKTLPKPIGDDLRREMETFLRDTAPLVKK